MGHWGAEEGRRLARRAQRRIERPATRRPALCLQRCPAKSAHLLHAGLRQARAAPLLLLPQAPVQRLVLAPQVPLRLGHQLRSAGDTMQRVG